MSNIELHLKTYDELQFEVMTLTTNSYLKDLKIKELQQRIDKAIKYIKETKKEIIKDYDYGWKEMIRFDGVLYILTGDKNE